VSHDDPQPTHVDVDFYVVAEPQWKDRRWYTDTQDRPILQGAKAVKITQARPTVTKGGVVTKLTLRFPASAFLPLQPEAIVEVGPSDAETIVVTATNPGEDPTP
jgi:hypothetical protein